MLPGKKLFNLLHIMLCNRRNYLYICLFVFSDAGNRRLFF